MNEMLKAREHLMCLTGAQNYLGSAYCSPLAGNLPSFAPSARLLNRMNADQTALYLRASTRIEHRVVIESRFWNGHQVLDFAETAKCSVAAG